MYIAELKGKLPAPLFQSKDILVSNVFSFFKYADREVFLSAFFRGLGIQLSGEELRKSEFMFWPSYGDNIKPDLVMIAGNYYILIEAKLIEAKYIADYNSELKGFESRFVMDIEYGLSEAKARNKEFLPVVITDHFNYIKDKEIKINESVACKCIWTNWQAISEKLFRLLEAEGPNLQDYLFAMDLYNLLEKKGLRNFRSFHEIHTKPFVTDYDEIFFAAKTARYRGSFVGFKNLEWRKINGDI